MGRLRLSDRTRVSGAWARHTGVTAGIGIRRVFTFHFIPRDEPAAADGNHVARARFAVSTLSDATASFTRNVCYCGGAADSRSNGIATHRASTRNADERLNAVPRDRKLYV